MFELLEVRWYVWQRMSIELQIQHYVYGREYIPL